MKAILRRSPALLAVCVCGTALAGEPVRFNRDVRPILADNCFACHGADSAARKADDEPFEDKMERLVAELSDQRAASDTLTAEIRKNLGALGYE